MGRNSSTFEGQSQTAINIKKNLGIFPANGKPNNRTFAVQQFAGTSQKIKLHNREEV
jgi:hypothetical protein